MNNQIIEDFKANRELFETFCEKTESLIQELIADSDVMPFKIESRTKGIESLEEKIKIKSKDKYKCLGDITDIAGLRIITYLESDVDKVADLIGLEFVVDPDNSIDKRDLESNEFGYRSLHVVASIDKTREKLREYKRFKGLKFEIQIRSILQHAWAEIEHDIGYKGKFTLPKSSKRNFNRLAALLETADIEFDRLKKSLTKYAAEVGEEIKTNPGSVELNELSLKSYLSHQSLVDLDSEISKISGRKINSSDTISSAFFIKELGFFDITSIEKLDTEIKNNKKLILGFIKLFSERTNFERSGEYDSGICLFYLSYALITKPENIVRLDEFMIYMWPGEYDEELIKDLEIISEKLHSVIE